MSSVFFSDFIVLRSISKSNYTVHLVTVKSTRKSYAVKVFPHTRKGPCKNYLYESRFSWISHPCIIEHVDHKPESKGFLGEKNNISYIMMELAPHGDFWTIITKTAFTKDTILARTYFRQLISGLKYLHSKSVCHMDLKPQNLLLGEDYLLKITDFDHAMTEEDMLVFSKGTKSFRAPEVVDETVTIPQAADVYSLGIILFCFVIGHLPYREEVDGLMDEVLWLLRNNHEDFWKSHRLESYDDDFKSLFLSMVEVDPAKRIDLKEIENTPFMKKGRYRQEEMVSKIKETMALIQKV
jgi:serine/threonine protein kinase